MPISAILERPVPTGRAFVFDALVRLPDRFLVDIQPLGSRLFRSVQRHSFAAVMEILDTAVTDNVGHTIAVPFSLGFAPYHDQRLHHRHFDPRLLRRDLAIASHPGDRFSGGQGVLRCLPGLPTARQPLLIPGANYRRQLQWLMRWGVWYCLPNLLIARPSRLVFGANCRRHLRWLNHWRLVGFEVGGATLQILHAGAVPLDLRLGPHLSQRLDCCRLDPRLCLRELAKGEHPADRVGGSLGVPCFLPGTLTAHQLLLVPSADQGRQFQIFELRSQELRLQHICSVQFPHILAHT